MSSFKIHPWCHKGGLTRSEESFLGIQAEAGIDRHSECAHTWKSHVCGRYLLTCAQHVPRCCHEIDASCLLRCLWRRVNVWVNKNCLPTVTVKCMTSFEQSAQLIASKEILQLLSLRALIRANGREEGQPMLQSRATEPVNGEGYVQAAGTRWQARGLSLCLQAGRKS